jgi:hypothetical protein
MCTVKLDVIVVSPTAEADKTKYRIVEIGLIVSDEIARVAGERYSSRRGLAGYGYIGIGSGKLNAVGHVDDT